MHALSHLIKEKYWYKLKMIQITVICNRPKKQQHSLNMGTKTRLSIYCTKQRENPANLVTSPKINARLVRPIKEKNNVVYYTP